MSIDNLWNIERCFTFFCFLNNAIYLIIYTSPMGKLKFLKGWLSVPMISQHINDRNRIQAQVFLIKTHSLSVPPLCKFIFFLSSLMRVNNIHKLFFKIESKCNDVAIRTCVATAGKITFVRSYNHFHVKPIHILSE